MGQGRLARHVWGGGGGPGWGFVRVQVQVGQGSGIKDHSGLGTASATFSHCEGSIVARVAVQGRGRGSMRREVTGLQLGSPTICVCVHAAGYMCKCRLTFNLMMIALTVYPGPCH